MVGSRGRVVAGRCGCVVRCEALCRREDEHELGA